DHQSGVLADPIHQPQMYVEETLHLLDLIQNMSLVEADIEENLKVANDLKTALRTQPLSFVLQFIDMNGLEYLLDFLRSMNNDVRQSQLHYIILGSIKALMNNSDGRAHVLAHPTGITVIAQSLKTNNNKIKILTLEILGAVCLVPGGHKKVLNSMVHFQQFACERTRFQTVVMDLARSLDEDDSDSAALQVAVLSFLNALINYKAGEESLEFRLHLRYEFLMLGIQPIIARLRFLAIPQLIKHIEIFEFVRIEDEKEFTAQLNIVS
ncbi:PREDICTED: disheveled-associated activator of morphogenesis 1-A-like, partial [Amphimedon queenslandica]|uniref:GBD/FH3 domain-containing protein n=1 Tax=Amphimedon queenslandica TaxID=400682 RepID=A0AAN0IL31_AMPQE